MTMDIRHFCYHESPIGPLLLSEANGRLLSLTFTKEGKKAKPGTDWIRNDASFDAVRSELDGYFGGSLRRFTVRFDLQGSPFQLAVWKALQTIPFGSVRSYGDIARMVGKPLGAQAVGMANHVNPIPIIVPCHRVIGADGSLVGFGGGLETKIWLLEHEGISPSQVHSPDQLGFSF
ncbi:methylated-DNA--[protein]-cysteine S-methyltransferase [uncultured Cohaesibacter sp.]|uniref:methylated-DNA--[protein]-cysteine S-methyltransferase n=1 Tax=uncultured Cohaesibacter sp. TaxID=1002546 RepID=UPI00292CC7C0|nr:methylated-DNA--[protein]-cysteine S-methyltransferase [uncultured Cohaesibacter sp.]